MAKLPGGVWPAMLTPLTEDRQPNLPVIDQLVDLFVSQKMDGLYVLGATGQGPALSMEIRQAVAQRAIARAKGRIAVMVHVGCITTWDTITLARHAEKCGADAISSIPPLYFGASADAMFEHYRRIAASTSLPFLPYHSGAAIQGVPPAQEYARRLMEIPNLAGMKLTDQNMYLFTLLVTYTAGKLLIYSGPDELVCQAALSGAHGAIGTTYNVWGPAVRKVRAAFLAGDVNLGRSFMSTYDAAIDQLQRSGALWGFMRSAMRLAYGIEIGLSCLPSAAVEKPLPDEQALEIINRVNKAAGV